MFAIVNIKTGKWLYGTDFRYSPPRQRTSHNKMKTYNLDRVNVIMPCEEGTEFVFDAFSIKVNIPYDDVVETVTRKHK